MCLKELMLGLIHWKRKDDFELARKKKSKCANKCQVRKLIMIMIRIITLPLGFVI
jgi:hypothetical protein